MTSPLTSTAAPAKRLATAVAAVRSVLTYVVTALYVLLAGPPGMLLAIAFKWKGLLYELGHGGVAVASSLAGIRWRVAGRGNLTGGVVVFCANHQSNIDPPILFQVLHRRLHVLYKAELKALPILGRAFGVGGFVAVDRRHREQSIRAIQEGAESLRAGNPFLIFPEGTRSRTDDLLPFKKGGFLMAIQAQVPVVPVAVQGGRDAMRKGSAIIRPVTMSIRIGRPVSTTGLGVDDRDRLIAEVRAAVDTLLAMGPVGPEER